MLPGRCRISSPLSLSRSPVGGRIVRCESEKKVEERANTARELQRIQEEAARLAEQNATLQRELNLAQ